jgi:hypothetical protein
VMPYFAAAGGNPDAPLFFAHRIRGTSRPFRITLYGIIRCMSAVPDYLQPKTEVWTFGGIRNVSIPNDPLELGSGFSLTKPNEMLLSARTHYAMNEDEYQHAATVGTYLLYKTQQPAIRDERRNASIEEFQHGLMAFQIIKPVQTLGFVFQGEKWKSTLNSETINKRPPTDAGQWARMRCFDEPLLAQVNGMIPKIFNVMKGTNAEHKNSIILLQLALEQPHPLISGLLSIMGIEARFDSEGRDDFKNKLCSWLGSSTRAFPDWNSPEFSQPSYTVEELAIPIYMLRNKLAHGVDLRKAAFDKSTPVDLVKKVQLIRELEPIAHAYLLSQAAIHIHCQLLKTCL